ncbi:ABC transporter permease [Alteribacter natronophilus]|uniref:ABC transporter permease n=1 Tax=Alteribacter natronophilus TaxID=2583810 RepID=UPI00110DA376|nr:ABC transporter permease [Alteribacter natronophilus]TMW72909.1 ABC transporter permease [Alteribacter natronophilus]
MQQPALNERYEHNVLRQLLAEIWILFRIQFCIIRDQWAFIFILASIIPFSILMFLHFFTINPTEEMIVRIITGNMLFALVIMGINVMAQEISFQKHQGHFTFYASLPIEKVNFILANMFRGLIVSLPSFTIMAIAGQAVYGISFSFSIWLIPLITLTILSVVAVGVFLGFWSPNIQLTNLVVQALMMIISFMTPVLVDFSQLPLVLQWFSYIVPTTYAAEGLRELLMSGMSTNVLQNMGMLLIFTIVSYTLILKKIHWRGDS